MNVFIVGSPLETAMALDSRRLNKQIIECNQILDAIHGKTKAWANHPVTLMYKHQIIWLLAYMGCLKAVINGDRRDAYVQNEISNVWRPCLHTQEYFDQMKRRLYTKDKVHYSQWDDLGESQQNWYFVGGAWRIYENGKRVK